METCSPSVAYEGQELRDPFRRRGRAPTLAKMRRLLTDAQTRKGLRLLQPGCGPGRLTAVLAGAVGPSGRLEAREISPPRRLAGASLSRPPTVDFTI
jgi:hypothetical protein